MSASNDGDDDGEMSTTEASEFLRDLRDNLDETQRQQAIETGGGLMDFEESQLRQAIDVLGVRRAAEILDVEPPDGEPIGEQATLTGERARDRVPEERAEPAPEGTQTLSEFTQEDRPDGREEVGGLPCEQLLNALVAQLDQGAFDEVDRTLSTAVDRGCLDEADAEGVQNTLAGMDEGQFQTLQIENLQDRLREAFDVSEARPGGEPEAEDLTREEAEDVVRKAFNIEGAEAIRDFIDPDEMAQLPQPTAFQLRGAMDTLGSARIEEILQDLGVAEAVLEDLDDADDGGPDTGNR